ncbi:hypothetical protein TWF506_011483 [Arthrobotrys conoides]|uniref:Uncharacterized protein n=1 Tax=Arthrobotrys conoides TaxID=74498 RepID=A0AAN8NJW0_9PEZI
MMHLGNTVHEYVYKNLELIAADETDTGRRAQASFHLAACMFSSLGVPKSLEREMDGSFNEAAKTEIRKLLEQAHDNEISGQGGAYAVVSRNILNAVNGNSDRQGSARDAEHLPLLLNTAIKAEMLLDEDKGTIEGEFLEACAEGFWPSVEMILDTHPGIAGRALTAHNENALHFAHRFADNHIDDIVRRFYIEGADQTGRSLPNGKRVNIDSYPVSGLPIIRMIIFGTYNGLNAFLKNLCDEDNRCSLCISHRDRNEAIMTATRYAKGLQPEALIIHTERWVPDLTQITLDLRRGRAVNSGIAIRRHTEPNYTWTTSNLMSLLIHGGV